MTPIGPDPATEEESLGALFTRLFEDGKQFVRAEINYYKQMALHRVSGAAVGLSLAVAAILLLQSSLTALLVGLGVALASLIGLAGGIILVAVLGLLVSGLIAWIAVRRITAAASGADEAAAAARRPRP